MTTSTKRTRVQVINLLRDLATMRDREATHGAADDLLLELIDDSGITAAYGSIERWYA